MLISDHFFLLYFFPIFIGIYMITSYKVGFANAIVIFFSLIFYASFGVENLPILIIPLVADYILAILIYKTNKKIEKKILLTIGIIINLGILAYFKYPIFISENVSFISPKLATYFNSIKSTIIPLGISFITFQRISYIVDVYRKTTIPTTNFLHYATYACLFPHLISGPIVRFSFIHKTLAKRSITVIHIFEGAKYFTIGLAFKVLVANQLFLVEESLTQSLAQNHFYESIILLLTFSFRLYFDFLGYSLMALGLAKFMGFDFPVNFNSPYQSTSLTDFWRRWNITLSQWLRDYLYIPLGGNRKGHIRTYINLFITMLLAGLWHGASWSFVTWGSLHGFYLMIERFFKHHNISVKIHPTLQIFITFLVVTLTWSVFKFSKLSDLNYLFKPIVTLNIAPLSQDFVNILVPVVPSFIFAIIWAFFLSDELLLNLKPSIKTATILSLIFLITLGFLLIRRSVPFIYFQF